MVATAELLNDPAIRSYLLRLIKDEGIALIERFPDDGEHSDEELAEVTHINLNTVRHTLYTLYEKRLAEYRRIKNNETGWLTYLWQLRLDMIYTAIYDDMDNIQEKLRKKERYEEENDFFRCTQCGLLLTFNLAMDHDFTCPECGGTMGHFDNEVLLAALKRRRIAIGESLGHE